jgi:integrase
MWERMREQHRHPRHALTPRTVQSVKPCGRAKRIADGGGLYLLLMPRGSKSWVLRTIVKGKRTDIGLGGVDVVTLAEAREHAHQLRKIARSGGDPLEVRRRTRRVVPTFKEAAEEVHKAHSASFRSEKHRKQWLSSLDRVFSAFGTKRVDAIGSADLLAALSPQWLARPETSRRVLQRLRVIFDWCKAQGYCSGDNPTQGLTKVLPKHRPLPAHHAALPYQEVPSFVQSLRVADAREVVRLAFELTILCATRTSETLNATWEEIDFISATWTIPATRMKARIAHRVPLSNRSVAILTRAKDVSDGPFVFPGRTAEKPLSNMAFLMTLRRMKKDEVTVHGFRSSFRDWAAERTHFSRAVCEAALAHTLRDKTESAYNRTDLFEQRRKLMDAWSAFVTEKPADSQGESRD